MLRVESTSDDAGASDPKVADVVTAIWQTKDDANKEILRGPSPRK